MKKICIAFALAVMAIAADAAADDCSECSATYCAEQETECDQSTNNYDPLSSCDDVRACYQSSGCSLTHRADGWPQALTCYIGTASISGVIGHHEAPNGACASIMESTEGVPSGIDVLLRFMDDLYSIGDAYLVDACRKENCSTECGYH